MKTLDSIREEVAQREGYDTWDDLFMDAMTGSITSNVFDVVITDIATMYAEEAIEECADVAYQLIDHNHSAPMVENRIQEIKNQLK